MTGDRIDDVLAAYFRPDRLPPPLPERVVRAARESRRTLESLVDRLAIRASAAGVVRVELGRPEPGSSGAARRIVEEARHEVAQYLGGQRTFFSVPVDLSPVPEFQRRVLEAAVHIPFGEARPYAWVAERIGRPRAVRAVGTALGRNPVPLIVPCHRVLRSDGSYGGYSFGDPSMKERLLELERTTPVLEGSSRTHVVCRVGCPRAARMRPEQRIVFASVADARSVGYRPCRTCQPRDATGARDRRGG